VENADWLRFYEWHLKLGKCNLSANPPRPRAGDPALIPLPSRLPTESAIIRHDLTGRNEEFTPIDAARKHPVRMDAGQIHLPFTYDVHSL